MRKSELKAFIKEEITNTLSEDRFDNVEHIFSGEPALGTKLKVPNDLTTDPINKQGETGVLKAVNDEGTYALMFDDGLVGLYMAYIWGTNEAMIQTTSSDLDDILDKVGKEDTIKVVNEVNMGLADIEELGFEEGESVFAPLFREKNWQNKPDEQAYIRGFIKGVKSASGEFDLMEEFDDEKEPSKSAIKKGGKSIGAMQKAMVSTQNLLKSTLKKWQSAEGEEKERLLNQLKSLTKQKHELDQLI